jgi:predicted transposase YdaD
MLSLLKQAEGRGETDHAISALVYLLSASQMYNKDTFFSKVSTEMSTEIGEKAMTIAERLQEKSRIKTLREVAQKLKDEGMPLERISQLLGLPMKELMLAA